MLLQYQYNVSKIYEFIITCYSESANRTHKGVYNFKDFVSSQTVCLQVYIYANKLDTCGEGLVVLFVYLKQLFKHLSLLECPYLLST